MSSLITITILSLPSLRWRHNGCYRVSIHQPHHCLLNRLFGRKSRKTSKLRVTGLCAENSPGTGEFPAQMASYAEDVSIWWRHHDQHQTTTIIRITDNGRRLWKRFPYYWSFVRVSTGDTQIHGNAELWRFLSCWIEHSGEQIFRLQTVEWFDTHVITRPSVSPTGGVVSAVHTRPAAIKVTRGPYTHAIGSHNAVIYTHIRVVEAVAFWNKKPFTVNPLNLCMMNKHFVIRATLSIQVAELRIHKQTRCGTRFDTQ